MVALILLALIGVAAFSIANRTSSDFVQLTLKQGPTTPKRQLPDAEAQAKWNAVWGAASTGFKKRRVRYWTLSKPPAPRLHPLHRLPCYAANKIALICSDTKGKDDYSLSIDLDRKLASFHMSDLPDADDVPVTHVTENYIWFQNKASVNIYSQGKLDRLTGSLHFFHWQLNNAKDYYLRCKPAKPLDSPAR